ncbi:hypothetical protein GCM10028805_00670 [Spirosoma harenae]
MSTGSIRQVMIQFTALIVAIFYTCAALEIDLGETGDTFGDVYDTYVLSTSLQSPKPAVVDYRKIQAVAPPIALPKTPLALPAAGLLALVLAPLPFYTYKCLKRRRLQVLHDIWRL